MKHTGHYGEPRSPLEPFDSYSVDDVNDRPNVALENCHRLTWNVHPTGRKPMLSDSLNCIYSPALYRSGCVFTRLEKSFKLYGMDA